MTICAILIILYLVSIIVPIIGAVTNNNIVQNVLYWIFNLISPSINSQAIVTYIMAHKSAFCRISAGGSGDALFKVIGDDTIGVNWLILFLHIILLLSALILIDSGLLRYFIGYLFSFRSKKTQADESRLDDDVLAERRRILGANNPSYRVNNDNVLPDEEMIANDHLIVQDLKKQFPSRPWPAVNHLTFGAKRGEAFGLLGFNASHLSLSLSLTHFFIDSD